MLYITSICFIVFFNLRIPFSSCLFVTLTPFYAKPLYAGRSMWAVAQVPRHIVADVLGRRNK
ncbi:hypothetical protein EJ02DRAFT_67085 [Clathrospora elynae]|uniref:Uncharacterized protein n=1 Tax=Clathrospora elynae TaxID=706981 RepID=A0A6A5SZC8_9PLEO|nr:hypothetical protein EJ02DRAFT_67085 [Clathrospora elynae]